MIEIIIKLCCLPNNSFSSKIFIKIKQMYNNFGQNQMMQNNMNFMQMNNPMDQIQMISNMIQNNNQLMVGGNPNMNMNNNMNYNNMMNNNMNMNNNNQNNNIKFNICFSTVKGARIIMPLDGNETVDGMLTKFLKRCNLEYLINNIDKKLTFLLAGKSLKFGDYTKLKDIVLFAVTNVIVIDVNDLIGAGTKSIINN